MEKVERDFDCKITSKFGFEIITFKGKLTSEAKDSLETCTQEILGSQSKIFVINFLNVSGVESSVFRELTLLQREIRSKKVNLYLVGLGKDLKLQLIEKGIIRVGELRKSLEEVIASPKNQIA